MAFDINSITLVGRLTRDGQLTYTSTTNKAVYKFSIANNSGRADAQDAVSYFDVVVWDKMAEVCNQYLLKGSQVIVQGRLTQRRYQDQSGQEKSRIEIVASSVQFIGSTGYTKSDSQGSSKEEASSSRPSVSSDNLGDDDDIPF